MKNDYICDDRNQIEDLRKNREMTDKEFEQHIKELKEKENK